MALQIIVFKDSQLLNAPPDEPYPFILVTLLGIVIEVKAVQLMNVE